MVAWLLVDWEFCSPCANRTNAKSRRSLGRTVAGRCLSTNRDIVYTYPMTSPAEAWLARVRHDLVKRMVWPARDRRDLGGPVVAGELAARLIDGEGQDTSASALWLALLADAPAGVSDEIAAPFAQALADAEAGAKADRLAPVLALETAFDELARQVKQLK